MNLRIVPPLVAAFIGLTAWAFSDSRPAPQKVAPCPVCITNKYDLFNNHWVHQQIDEGRKIFRYDTFGNESFWGGTLKLHEAIAGCKLGGVGPGVGPKAALELGLKIDMDALPGQLVEQWSHGQVNLHDPANTLLLLKYDAVVGLRASFDPHHGKICSIGIQCALCHSLVDNCVCKGLGHRVDGWANRDLDVGKLICLAPNLKPIAELLEVDEDMVRKILHAWGPGKFDAELILDGKGFRPDGKTAATLIPPAFGLAGINLHTWTGWGSVPHWNAFVTNLEMKGKGTFVDARLNNPHKFPIAVKNGFAFICNTPDLITCKLPALHLYQLAIPAPVAPKSNYDPTCAARGQALFMTKAQCGRCHVPPLFTEPGWNSHAPKEIGIDCFQADRSPDGRYRTAPLRGLWTHHKGGFYHDGRFCTLRDVVNHYNQFLHLELCDGEIHDLVEFLRSL